jgi:hypothetical protein
MDTIFMALLIFNPKKGTVIVFSIITMALAAHLTNFTNSLIGGYYTFAALAIATAVLSIITIPVMIVVDNMRKGAFTSMIAFEIGWLSFLWILWLSSGATAAQANTVTFNGCHFFDCKPIGLFSKWHLTQTLPAAVSTACHEFSAIEAFSFLNWIICKCSDHSIMSCLMMPL